MFPQSPELAVYALACVQSFATHYGPAYERIALWMRHEDARRQLRIAVHCDQNFYVQFRNSFPANAYYALPGDDKRGIYDEMAVVLHESKLEQFELEPGYSIQWLMGMLSGTAPKMLPELSVTTRENQLIVDRRYAHLIEGSHYSGYLAELHKRETIEVVYVEAQALTVEQAYKFAQNAGLIIAPQSVLTVLGAAMHKRTLEITKTASHRPLMTVPNYVQVSRLGIDSFFQAALRRGLEWLNRPTLLKSAAPTVAAISEPSTRG